MSATRILRVKVLARAEMCVSGFVIDRCGLQAC